MQLSRCPDSGLPPSYHHSPKTRNPLTISLKYMPSYRHYHMCDKDYVYTWSCLHKELHLMLSLSYTHTHWTWMAENLSLCHESKAFISIFPMQLTNLTCLTMKKLFSILSQPQWTPPHLKHMVHQETLKMKPRSQEMVMKNWGQLIK